MIEKFTDLPLLQGFGDLFTKQIGRKRKFQFQNQNKDKINNCLSIFLKQVKINTIINQIIIKKIWLKMGIEFIINKKQK